MVPSPLLKWWWRMAGRMNETEEWKGSVCCLVVLMIPSLTTGYQSGPVWNNCRKYWQGRKEGPQSSQRSFSILVLVVVCIPPPPPYTSYNWSELSMWGNPIRNPNLRWECKVLLANFIRTISRISAWLWCVPAWSQTCDLVLGVWPTGFNEIKDESVQQW